MSVGDDLADSAARHTVYTLRYARSTYNRHSRLIDEAVADIASKLALRAPTDGTLTKKRLEAMLVVMRDTSSELYKSLQSAVDGDLRGLAGYESTFQTDAIQDAYPIKLALNSVTPAAIHAASMSKPFLGRVLRDWWSSQEYGVQRAFQSAVRIGHIQGESLPQIARRVRGVGDMTKRQAEAVIRTAVKHVSQVAMSETAKANPRIVKEEEWSATLDGRTTAICRALDGQRFPVGSGPSIPQHWGERSARVPVPVEWSTMYGKAKESDRLDTRPYVADKRRVKDIKKSERDSIVGTTQAKSYNDWLKTQRRPFVDDVLGKKKAKLYLDGKLPLDKFVDRQTGHEYTILELEKREKAAFKKAGIAIGGEQAA